MNRAILTSLALVATMVSAAPSFAQEVQTVLVSFADLNLSDPAGAKVFDARLHSAVRAVCGEVEASDLRGLAAVGRCRHDAWVGAKAQAAQIIASRGGAAIVLAAK